MKNSNMNYEYIVIYGIRYSFYHTVVRHVVFPLYHTYWYSKQTVCRTVPGIIVRPDRKLMMIATRDLCLPVALPANFGFQ